MKLTGRGRGWHSVADGQGGRMKRTETERGLLMKQKGVKRGDGGLAAPAWSMDQPYLPVFIICEEWLCTLVLWQNKQLCTWGTPPWSTSLLWDIEDSNSCKNLYPIMDYYKSSEEQAGVCKVKSGSHRVMSIWPHWESVFNCFHSFIHSHTFHYFSFSVFINACVKAPRRWLTLKANQQPGSFWY